MELEEQIDADNLTLSRATQVGQGKTIAALSISIHDARKKIEEAFVELESASKEHLTREREFEAKLEALGQADIDNAEPRTVQSR